MFKEKIITMPIIIAVVCLIFNYNTKADESSYTVTNALSVEDRVDEILNSFLYQYKGLGCYDYLTVKNASESGYIYNSNLDMNSHINRANTLASIMKVIGLDEDLVQNISLIEDQEYDLIQSYNNGSIFIANYIESALIKFDGYNKYDTSDSAGFKGSLANLDGVKFYPQRECTIEETLRFIARAINSDNSEDYIEIARDNGICSEEMLGRVNDYITISELRNILINLYSAKGDVYYTNSYEHLPALPQRDTEHDTTYYEKYVQAHTFSDSTVNVNGHTVSIMENGFGTKAVSLHDIIASYNAKIDWDNGKMTVTMDTGEHYTFFLEGYQGQIRLGNDGQLSNAQTVSTLSGSFNKRINLLGQYEMINGSVYLYPYAYFSILGFMDLRSEISPSELSYTYWGSSEEDTYHLYNDWRSTRWELSFYPTKEDIFDLTSDDVSEIYVQMHEPNKIDCIISDKTDIAYILYLLNTFKLLEINDATANDDMYNIKLNITTADSNVIEIGIIDNSYLLVNGKKYLIEQIKSDESSYFASFVYGICTGKIELKSEMTFEPSEWARPEIEKATAIPLLMPKRSQIDYTKNITREEACQLTAAIMIDSQIVYNNHLYRKADRDTPFSDVYDTSVTELYAQGIINGKTDTLFCPYDLMTREEFSKVLYNTYEYLCDDEKQNVQDIRYNDQNSISNWALESVNQLTALGIFKGNEKGNFDPKKNITKEEVIIAMLRLNDMLN